MRSQSLLASAIAASVILLLSTGLVPAVRVSSAVAGFSFSAAGDAGSWSGFDSSREALGRSGSNFFLAMGDLSYGGSSEEHWCRELKQSFPDAEILAGNHDVGEVNDTPDNGYPANINEFVKYCPYTLSSPLTGTYGKEYFFDYPQAAPLARFILTGCGLVWLVDNEGEWRCIPGDPHYAFVERSIDEARAQAIPWVVVVSHKNCITSGEHSCELGTPFFDLLLDKKVDLIVEGHTHHYSRSKQLALNPATCAELVEHSYQPGCVVNDGSDRQYQAGAGSVLVIAGTFGRAIDAFYPDSPYAPYFANWMDNSTTGEGKGFVSFDVDQGRIALRTTFVNATKPFTDSFTIRRPSNASPLVGTTGFLPWIVLAAIGGGAAIVGFQLKIRARPKPANGRIVPPRRLPRGK